MQNHFLYYIYWMRGFFRFLRKRDEQVIAHFSKAISLSSNTKQRASAYQKRLFCYWALGQHQNAILDATWLIENGFIESWIYEFRADSHARLGELDKAIEDYALAQKVVLRPLLLLKRGLALYDAKRYKEATEEFTQCVHLEQVESVLLSLVYYHRSMSLYALNEFENALVDMNEHHKLRGQKPLKTVNEFMNFMELVKQYSP